MHFIKNLVFTFACLFAVYPAAFAQQKVEKLIIENQRFENRGRDIVVSSSLERTVTVELSANSKVYTWSNGLVQKYDADYSYVGFKNSNGNEVTFNAESVLVWKGKSLNLDSPRNVKFTYISRIKECGKVDLDLTSKAREIDYETLINGESKKIKAVLVILDGKWSATCGIGKQQYELVYSPEYDLILRHKDLNFRPDSFLNAGQGWHINEIVLSK
jgi:hypothetical protein